MHGSPVSRGGTPVVAFHLLAVVFVASLPSAAVAGRVGGITISVDGKTWLTASTYDNGSPPPASVWRELSTRGLEPADGVTISPDPTDTLRTTLRGKIVIDVRYAGKAEVNELRLVRAGPTAGWTVDPDEVERMAKQIGLGEVAMVVPEPRVADPAPVSRDIPWLWVAGIGAVALVAFVLIAMLLVRRRGHEDDTGSGRHRVADDTFGPR
jgi:hypothetical protein